MSKKISSAGIGQNSISAGKKLKNSIAFDSQSIEISASQEGSLVCQTK